MVGLDRCLVSLPLSIPFESQIGADLQPELISSPFAVCFNSRALIPAMRESNSIFFFISKTLSHQSSVITPYRGGDDYDDSAEIDRFNDD